MRKLIHRWYQRFYLSFGILTLGRIAKNKHITLRAHFRLGTIIVIDNNRLDGIVLDVGLKLRITQVLLRALFFFAAKQPHSQ